MVNPVRWNRVLTAALITAVSFTSVMAQETVFGPLKVFVNYEVGQIEEGHSFINGNIDREFINHASVWTLQEARLHENAAVNWGVGAAYFFVFPRNLGPNPYVHSKRSAVGLTEAHGVFDFAGLSQDEYLMRLKIGIFGYKYNSDAKNLGEYMYRTWTYPNIINTGGLDFINSAGAQLSGLSAGTRMGGFSNDLLLTIETDRPPVFGLSLTDIASYDIGGIINIGGGVMFNNFYNPDPRQVSPRNPDNSYYTLSDGRKMAQSQHEELMNANDSATMAATVVDTGYYTFEGIKLMARASASIGKILNTPLIKAHELKFYGEAILLGTKDYPSYYEDIQDRMVYMAGVNLPTFGLLDMLSLEAEYCSNTFKSSTVGALENGSATPFVAPGEWFGRQDLRGDDVKWTLYAQRNILPGMAVYGQIARDHIRMLDVFSTPDKTEFLPERDHWYWALKLAYAL
jgi:hypothetical protein